MILSKDIYYNAEVWTLILHLLCLALVLFLFSRWLPTSHRQKSFSAEWADKKGLVLTDLLCSGIFIILLLLSAALILFPTNSFSINATTERVAGQVEQMERRNYIWMPSYTLNHQEYTGAYLQINGETYYCAVGEELQVGDDIELLRAKGCDYVMRYKILDAGQDTPTEFSRPAWELILQYIMLGLGAYLLVRSLYYLWQIFTFHQKSLIKRLFRK